MEHLSDKTILKVESLNKSFKNIKAVNDISFSLDQGDIFAFLGPNGAGKTTTLRVLLDIIKPDGGQVQWNLNGVNGSVPPSRHVGYLPEERGLYPDIPVMKSLVYLASIRGMEPSEAKRAALEWLERLDLADRAREKLQVLSKGNQQKIQFVASILHKPSFAILDEPFSGLDPLNQEKFIEYIKEINQQGTTILLSAHQMSLIEKVANKVFLINEGREVFNGPIANLYDDFGKKHIIDILFKAPVSESTFQGLSHVENIKWVGDCRVMVTFNQDSGLNKALAELAGIEGMSNITSHKPDLHEIFVELVKKSKK